MPIQPKICFVIPYFGCWPFWMPFFLESCRTNSSIDWMLFTDCGLPENCPDNVKVVSISYANYCERLSNALNIKFRAVNPYKLCDMKPALGFVHADDLMDYDFWGFGDIDLIYGNLRAFFTSERLATFDLFSTHARRISGHFCLIRNTEEMRTAFMRVKYWQSKLECNEHLAFDESAFSKIFLRHKNSPAWYRELTGFFDPWLKKAEFKEAYSTPNAKIAWLDGTYNFPGKWIWTKGELRNDMDGNRSFPYFHFMIWKRQWRGMLSDLSCNNDSGSTGIEMFSVTANGFSLIAESTANGPNH